MSQGSSERVRLVASEKYVQPAVRAGKTHFSIAVKDLLKDLVSEGFPPGNTPQVCTALRKNNFLREQGIEIESVEGPPSKTSTTVVFRYRVTSPGSRKDAAGSEQERPPGEAKEETPEEWAHRVTGKLAGLLKDELAEYGGGDAFIRWVRGYDEGDEK